MCVKMCEFDESNIQLGTTRYHSILHALPWYFHNCTHFMVNCDWNKTTKSKSLWNFYCKGSLIFINR
jgi:hypothetical protein